MASPPTSPPMRPRRPYLLRAIHEWITDSLCTPHIVVDATLEGVEVPRQYVKDGKIVLNVSWNATANLRIGNEELSFSGRFGGSSMSVSIPITAVLAIYARETGQGMIFTDEDVEAAAPATTDATAPPTSKPGENGSGDQPPPPRRPPGGGRAKLKVVK
jgi:stringent starvation protein B